MAEGVSRRRPGLAGYFGIKIRALAAEVRKLLVDADRDNDPVSITILSRGPAQQGSEHLADGAVVILKGGPTVALFCQWAERNKILTRGKSIVCEGGDTTVDERVRSLIERAAFMMTGMTGTLAMAQLVVDLFNRLSNDGLVEDAPLVEVAAELAVLVEREDADA